MAKRLRCTFETEIDVEFENPEAAAAYFLTGEWPTVFYKLRDLDEVAETLAYAFLRESDSWDAEAKRLSRSPEGFGKYRCMDNDPHVFQVSDEAAKEFGGWIRIRIETEMENTSVAEVEI